MKTIAMCALLAALAFGLLPGNRDEAAASDAGLVLLVETREEAEAPRMGCRKRARHGMHEYDASVNYDMFPRALL